MANLTGEYDVVVEAGMGLLNAVLGAVHENQHPSYPTMPHSLSFSVDDSHRGPADPVAPSERTGIRSRVEVSVGTPIVSLPVDTILVRPEVGPVEGAVLARSHEADPSTRSRPEVGGVLDDQYVVVGPRTWASDHPKVTAQVRMRAWVRDATASGLPEFVDGDLFVTVGLVASSVQGVGTFVTLDRTHGPTVTFRATAGSQVTAAQQQVIANVVRNVIRADMQPPTFKVALPADVRHFDFLLQPEAHRPSILLMLMLTDETLTSGARNSVQSGFLPDGADFAIAVGRDFVVKTLKENLFQGVSGPFHGSKVGVSATIRPDFAGASFDLVPGRIEFRLHGDGDISWWGVNDHFTFDVRQDFSLQLVDGSLRPVAVGDPVVDVHDVAVGGGYIEGRARTTIREERDKALAAAGPVLTDQLDLTSQLRGLMAGINPAPAGVTLTGVEIRADGVVLPGRMSLAASGPVVADQAVRASMNDALVSWIPGGTIDRYVWERSFPDEVRVDEHRFVTEVMTGKFLGGFCLTVEGTRVMAGGGRAPVRGTACYRFSPIITPVIDGLTVQGDDGPPPRPLLPLTDVAGDGSLQVIGHYDPWAPGRVPPEGHAHLLLHFASAADEGTSFLQGALGATKQRESAVLAVGVVPAGGLRGLREAPDDVLWAEDTDGSWAKAFAVAATPATVLVGPDGDVTFRADEISAADLATVLDDHATGRGEVAFHPIRLTLPTGRRVPDLPLRLPSGVELSLRRLKGRSIALVFCSPRSEPSLDHLEYLREVGRGEDTPIVIGVCDTESSERVAEIIEERQIPFLLLADPGGRIASVFGVWSWPATVWVRPDQVVEAIDVGALAAASRGGPEGSDAVGSP